MHRSTSLRLATIGFAVVAAIAVQGTAAGAGTVDDAVCRTWQPSAAASTSAGVEHSLNPTPPGEQTQHAWNPESTTHANPWESNTEAAAAEHSVNPRPPTTNDPWSPAVESDSSEHSGC